jgi:aminopeptidase N
MGLFASGCGLAEPPAPELDLADEQALSGGRPRPGAPGIGDALYPNLGNGGYEVEHYRLDLRYPTAAPTEAFDGTVTISARATQALSRFDVDFAGDSIGGVTVDGCAAEYSWDGEEIVITPAHPLGRGQDFTVVVSHFAATPKVPDPAAFLDAPFFTTPDGTAWAHQPHNAHRVFPSNDHPRDPATFSFRLDVPTGTTAVANGELVGKRAAGDRTIWRYEQRQPMATELAQVAVGAFTVIPRGVHRGVIVRDVVPTRLAAELAPKLAIEIPQLDWLEERLGAYPFGSHGSIAVDTRLGFALETQTMSLYETRFFTDQPEAWYAPIMLHELSHQWFGDSVAPGRWSDVWQNEGHATWYELTYQLDPDSPEFTDLMQVIYSLGDIWRAALGPVGAPPSGDPLALFNPNVYYGGALALYALRQQIGDAAFRRVERTWVTRYRGGSAFTADFIALASEISGQDLTKFLQDWLYGTATPPMPGHPDWTADPVAPALLAPADRSADRSVARQVPMKSLPPLLRH